MSHPRCGSPTSEGRCRTNLNGSGQSIRGVVRQVLCTYLTFESLASHGTTGRFQGTADADTGDTCRRVRSAARTTAVYPGEQYCRPTADLRVADLGAKEQSLMSDLSLKEKCRPTIDKPHLSIVSWRPPIAA